MSRRRMRVKMYLPVLSLVSLPALLTLLLPSAYADETAPSRLIVY